MSQNSSKTGNRVNVPEARGAMDRFKYEVANEIGVNLKQGYNGDLTSKQAGSIGGMMVKKMIEKVNPKHPDKIADRIAGAIVDLGYKLQDNPKIAVEVLIGHGVCHVIVETSVDFNKEDIENITVGQIVSALGSTKQLRKEAENNFKKIIFNSITCI